MSWTEHKAPDGRIYYYNRSSSESAWRSPTISRALRSSVSPAAHGRSTSPTPGRTISTTRRPRNPSGAFP
ncbi:PremRNAprocessing factor 40 -like protein Alike [Caligus rogercresseyi]|uniref:PremRNAprocessing factor 40 -like protein Alike n=1 Tax=Caligus rogercresseyi TaxID=217165 RepID=A0A7T8GWJ6_CALRO|nr:PremRNAprocessing factor 40 -like protein Alike [Caligus rogercresseyi]